jgi:hypothetical protein
MSTQSVRDEPVRPYSETLDQILQKNHYFPKENLPWPKQNSSYFSSPVTQVIYNSNWSPLPVDRRTGGPRPPYYQWYRLPVHWWTDATGSTVGRCTFISAPLAHSQPVNIYLNDFSNKNILRTDVPFSRKKSGFSEGPVFTY